MSITRRVFLKGGAMAVVGTTVVPAFLQRVAFASEMAATGKKRFVVIFQRGAADGLNIVVPHGEASYYAMRPTIAIPRQQVIDLDGFFGLHPAMASFQPLWDQGHLAIVHAAGSPDPTRSHFDAQDYMESGTPGVKSTEDGWLNRTLRNEACVARTSGPGTRVEEPCHTDSPFRAVALGSALPRMLSGSALAVAISNVNNFAVGGPNPQAQPLAKTFEAMYDQSVDAVLHGTGEETFDAVKMLKAADPQKYTPAPGAHYPRGPLGNALRQVAQLMKADLGVEVAFSDVGGWDHHVNEGSVQGQLAQRLRDLSQAMAAFWTDLGNRADETVVVTMSEFGRTARENGNRGTDHGHANVMFILGGPVRGRRVYGRWPGLQPEHLHEGRDLALTTDFRTVLSEVVYRHLGNHNLDAVFPGFRAESSSFLRFLA
jgi:uncharacterized protein (DUF1501 family)